MLLGLETELEVEVELELEAMLDSGWGWGWEVQLASADCCGFELVSDGVCDGVPGTQGRVEERVLYSAVASESASRVCWLKIRYVFSFLFLLLFPVLLDDA